MKLGKLEIHPLSFLIVFAPVAVVLRLVAPDEAVWIFLTSGLSIVPLAGWMGEATEHLAARLGPGLGGLLNATFGNAAEMIIAVFALVEGLHSVVLASLTGSIVGNSLLVLGLAILAGGLKQRRQTFNRTAAGLGASLLLLSMIGLVVPAVFHFMRESSDASVVVEHDLSLAIAIVLFVAYALSLVFSLVTHRHLYGEVSKGEPTSAEASPDAKSFEGPASGHAESWSIRKSMLWLFGATLGVAIMAEFLVGAVEGAVAELGLTHLFVGVILVAIVGNAAEHSTAVLMALRDKMDLAYNIAIGSSIQIALFVAPVLVFFSHALGAPMDLLFHPFEVIAVVLSALITSQVVADGECHWMEGVLLVAVYVILGFAFFFLPEMSGAAA